MEKITIKLAIDKDNNIFIENKEINKKVEIKYSSKTLNAQDIYDIFNYEKGNSYDINSDIDEVNDKKIKEYYSDIISLFEAIKKELNDLQITDDNS
jgi:hypothetical protein